LQYLYGEVAGNPVRQEIKEVGREAARAELQVTLDEKVVLVMGGSQGARHLNEVVRDLVKELPENLKVIHLVGGKNDLGEAGANYQPISYEHNVGQLLAVADLVISRAGATAISEFLVRGLPMILVPFPYAANDHQTMNAKAVVEAGAAEMIRDQDLSVHKLLLAIKQVELDYDKMSQASRRLAKPNATERIVDYLYA
ncbi:MAG: glycosyltransferase, partial [bacterium]